MGDFTLLTSKDSSGKELLQTIPPNSSATIDMLATDFKECNSELYYDYNQDDRRTGRPQMALKFKNCLPHSLQKGPCNVFIRDKNGIDLFQGTALLPTSKPGESQRLLHGEDTAVDISREGGTVQSSYRKITIEKGVLYTETVAISSIKYTIRSVKQESCDVVVDHAKMLQTSELASDTPVYETTKNGNRYKVTVRAGGTVDLKITETSIQKSQVDFVDIGWLQSNVIALSHPSKESIRGLDNALKIQREIAAAETKYSTLAREESNLEKQQGETRKNFEILKGSAHLTAAQDSIVANDKRLMEIRTKTLPGLSDEINKLKGQLRESLKEVTLGWTNK